MMTASNHAWAAPAKRAPVTQQIKQATTPAANTAASGKESRGDHIVAVVGNEVITWRQLQTRYDQVLDQLKKQNTPLPEDDLLQVQVLERMVMERAQLQQAKETSITIEDAQLDRAIDRLADLNKLTRESMQAQLAKDGISWERFREEIRNEMTIQRLREREVDSKVVVTDEEVDNFLASNAGDGKIEVHLAHILLRVPENASAQEQTRLRTQAKEILDQLKGGENFAKLAASYSNSNDSTKGGDLGWRELDRLPALYAETARSLAPGEISGILQSPAGLHIIKVLERRGDSKEDAAPIDQTHVRHILIKTSDVVSDSDALHRLQVLRERIQNGEDFAELARRNSADLSAAKGGDIGWVSPGDTVPAFERNMAGLAPNAISQPFKSPFGWHLIQVLERRTQGLSEERRRANARSALRERKIAESYDEWLQQLHDRTHIELRLDELKPT